jgi:hypothetical protein
VAGSSHEFCTKNAGQKGLGSSARVEKDKIAQGGDAPKPATEGECAEAADRTAPFVPAGLEAAPVTEEELAPAHGDVVAAAVPVEEDAAADASEAAHAAELEATLLAASSPGGEGPVELAVDAAVASVEAPEVSVVLSEAPVVTEGAEV